MTTGASGGAKGGAASAVSRLRKVVTRAPRVRVIAKAPASKRERREAARPAGDPTDPHVLDADALISVTASIVEGVVDKLGGTPKQRGICAAAATAAASAAGAAILQLVRRWQVGTLCLGAAAGSASGWRSLS